MTVKTQLFSSGNAKQSWISGFQAVSAKLPGSSEMPRRLQGKGTSVCWGVGNWGGHFSAGVAPQFQCHH